MEQRSFIGIGLAVGAGVGAALGVALDNIALGIGLGVAIGLGLGVTLDAADGRKAGKAGKADNGGGSTAVVGDSRSKIDDHPAGGSDGGGDGGD